MQRNFPPFVRPRTGGLSPFVTGADFIFRPEDRPFLRLSALLGADLFPGTFPATGGDRAPGELPGALNGPSRSRPVWRTPPTGRSAQPPSSAWTRNRVVAQLIDDRWPCQA